MRVGVVVGLHKDTDLKEKFSELREMGMESCQLVCWDRTLLNEEMAALVKQAVEEEKIGAAGKAPGPGIFMKGRKRSAWCLRHSGSRGCRC